MVNQADTAYVRLWGNLVGAVLWDSDRELGIFEFDKGFMQKGIDISPLQMPVADALKESGRFEFPMLSKQTFKGLPGLLADALPDHYGNNIIDAWLARQGRTPESFSPVERLCYTGTRAIGALEFYPIKNESIEKSAPVEVAALVGLASSVINERSQLKSGFKTKSSKALMDIIRVGTSAGGNRPKAVIALNDQTNEVRSGQVEAPEGFDHWVLKLDGVEDNTLKDPKGYGRIEYAYHQMAVYAKIHMTECRLLEENSRAHFMTRRFDRQENQKKHMQSLCALAHFDFNATGLYSYEQAFQVMRELRLPYNDAEQLFRRMVFNVVARNQDDHTKNIAFLMNEKGEWRLSPAFDVIYSYHPKSRWTSQHQMSINGKRENILRQDFLQVGGEMNIKSCNSIVDEIVEAVSHWPQFAEKAGIPTAQIKSIRKTHILL